jgi:hypothetical protein
MGESSLTGSDRCFRCGAMFPRGGLRYRIDIRVAADTGGEVDEAGNLSEELIHLLSVIEGKDEDELEREVHEDFRFYLCKACKDEYLRGPDVPLDMFFFGE